MRNFRFYSLAVLAVLLGSTMSAHASWSRCGSEGGDCNMSNNGHNVIRYGADGKYFTIETDGLSQIACNNGVFGDPARGADKTCEYTTVTTRNDWVNCSAENGVCQLPDAQIRYVRYGTSNGWVYKLASSSIRCSNDEFPDVANGSAKQCAYSKQTVFPSANGNQVQFKDCGTENTDCNLGSGDATDTVIRFGTGNTWEYRMATLTTFPCSRDTFAGDVAEGKLKFCQFASMPPQITAINGEWTRVGSCRGCPLRMDVVVGVSSTHTSSRTETWGVEAAMAIEQEFNYFSFGKSKVSVSVKHSESVAKLMSDALTRQTATTKSAQCPTADKVDMFQWTMNVDELCFVRDGQCRSTVSSFNIICALNQPNDFRPVCPPTMCADKMCTVCTNTSSAPAVAQK